MSGDIGEHMRLELAMVEMTASMDKLKREGEAKNLIHIGVMIALKAVRDHDGDGVAMGLAINEGVAKAAKDHVL